MTDCRVIHGDALHVLPTLESGSVDCVITDSPYGVSVAGSAHVSKPGFGTRSLDLLEGDCNWQATIFTAAKAARECLRLLSPLGSVYWWIGHRQMGTLVSLFEGEGFSTRFLVWAKKCPPPQAPGAGWPSGAELCLYAYRPGRKWNFRNDPPRSNVLVYDSYRFGQPDKCGHPTQKPTALMRNLVEASSHPGDLVLDPFAGSGTTGVACVQTGRRFLGIEIDRHWCDVAERRIAEAAPLFVQPREKAVQLEFQ